MAFDIERINEGKKTTLKIIGPLDTKTSPLLQKELQDDLRNIDELILDLEQMPYLTSAGIRVLLMFTQGIEGHGSLKLINVNDVVKELFETIGFLDLITIE